MITNVISKSLIEEQGGRYRQILHKKDGMVGAAASVLRVVSSIPGRKKKIVWPQVVYEKNIYPVN